jgi:ribose 5-phosphate isomerase B
VHAHLSKKGYIVSDFGTYSQESVDYPDFADAVTREVTRRHGGLRHSRLQKRDRHEYRRDRHPQIRASTCR